MAEYNPSAVAKQAKQVINEPVPVQVVDGKFAPYRGGDRTRDALERNEDKGAPVDYVAVVALSTLIRRYLRESMSEYFITAWRALRVDTG